MKKFQVYEEIHYQTVVDSETQNRRADIIVIDRKMNQRFVFDPIICWETNVLTQDGHVNAEKRAIYVL